MNFSGKKRLKISEVAVILNVTPGLARNLLREWGVEPCADYGPGRGRGLRWSSDDIDVAAERTVNRKRPTPPRRPRRHALDGANIVADLFG